MKSEKIVRKQLTYIGTVLVIKGEKQKSGDVSIPLFNKYK